MVRELTESERYQARYAHLLGETAKIAWSELQLFYAKGQVIKLNPSLDLVEAATRVSLNAEQTVSEWIGQGIVQKVEDSDAAQWFDASATLWAVVVSPWVLVQAEADRSDAGEPSV